MLENSFYTNNNVDKQVFNASGPVTYLSQGTGSYMYLGVNAAGIPLLNGDFYQRTTTTVAYFKTDSTGATVPTPKVLDQFTYGDGTSNGWINANITVVTDSGTYWILTLGTAFAGALTISTNYTLDTKRPNYQWQTWSKPEGRSMAYIVCIGGGGGGGGGSSNIPLGSKGGGGGGASSVLTIAQVPFYSIPDTLYIQVGLGGVGGTRAVGGGTGGISYVSCYPTIDMFNCLVVNALVGANGGSAGSNSASVSGGAAGAALSASATNNPRYLSLCNWASYASQAGGNGSGGVTAGISVAQNINSITTSGAGAGGASAGVSGAGGTVTSGDTLASFLKGTIGNGYSYLKPFLFVGGAGGGGSFNGTANIGSNGSIGSGGGGGGGGVTGNSGGNGGNGLVMIISY